MDNQWVHATNTPPPCFPANTYTYYASLKGQIGKKNTSGCHLHLPEYLHIAWMGMKTPRIIGCLGFASSLFFKLRAVIYKELAHTRWGFSVAFTRSPVQPVKTVAHIYFGNRGVLAHLGGRHRVWSRKRCSTRV